MTTKKKKKKKPTALLEEEKEDREGESHNLDRFFAPTGLA